MNIAIRTTLVTLLLTGIAYPLGMTGLARIVFPAQADGSLVKNERGQIVGSRLLGQAFVKPEYFQPRPSAAGSGYDATSSGGSNLGPTSAKLRDRAKAEIERLHKENPDAPSAIPAELVTTSASGLDPHVSPAAAYWQLPRVAKARGISPERIRPLVDDAVEGRDLGIFGEPHVNVLLLNLALDRRFGAGPSKLDSANGQAVRTDR